MLLTATTAAVTPAPTATAVTIPAVVARKRAPAAAAPAAAPAAPAPAAAAPAPAAPAPAAPAPAAPAPAAPAPAAPPPAAPAAPAAPPTPTAAAAAALVVTVIPVATRAPATRLIRVLVPSMVPFGANGFDHVVTYRETGEPELAQFVRPHVADQRAVVDVPQSDRDVVEGLAFDDRRAGNFTQVLLAYGQPPVEEAAHRLPSQEPGPPEGCASFGTSSG